MRCRKDSLQRYLAQDLCTKWNLCAGNQQRCSQNLGKHQNAERRLFSGPMKPSLQLPFMITIFCSSVFVNWPFSIEALLSAYRMIEIRVARRCASIMKEDFLHLSLI